MPPKPKAKRRPPTRQTTQQPAPQPAPQATQPSQAQARRQSAQTQQAIRRATSAPGVMTRPIEVRGSDTVKMEFMIGIVLILLAPIGDSGIKLNKDYVRHIVGWCLIFMILFPMSNARTPGIVRTANGIGGLLLLTLVVKGPKSGFGIDVLGLLSAIVKKLQPGGNPSAAQGGAGSNVGGPVKPNNPILNPFGGTVTD